MVIITSVLDNIMRVAYIQKRITKEPKPWKTLRMPYRWFKPKRESGRLMEGNRSQTQFSMRKGKKHENSRIETPIPEKKLKSLYPKPIGDPLDLRKILSTQPWLFAISTTSPSPPLSTAISPDTWHFDRTLPFVLPAY
ncbi:unnamed protein product [Caenorhabditis nigoni]